LVFENTSHLPKWKFFSSNEGTFHIQKVFPNTKEKKPWKMLLCRKPWHAINWDVPHAFLKLSGLLLRAISNFLAYSFLLQPPLDYKPQI
jgi:hypothetical protein